MPLPPYLLYLLPWVGNLGMAQLGCLFRVSLSIGWATFLSVAWVPLLRSSGCQNSLAFCCIIEAMSYKLPTVPCTDPLHTVHTVAACSFSVHRRISVSISLSLCLSLCLSLSLQSAKMESHIMKHNHVRDNPSPLPYSVGQKKVILKRRGSIEGHGSLGVS